MPGKAKIIFPMEAQSVSILPQGREWIYEPKWDGFRCLAFKSKGKITLQSKSGKPLGRYFPDIIAALEKLKTKEFILDGELLIKIGNKFSFADLQMRLHPAASRVNKLAAEQPANYVVFDLLMDNEGNNLINENFKTRRQELEQFYKKFAQKEKTIILSPQTSKLSQGKKWVEEMGADIDGLIAKNLDDQYMPAERQMQKYKFIRSADCVVGGFRYGTNSKLVGSLLLGLYDENGLLNHVGFTSAIAKEEKAALTKKLEKLKGGPGFTGNAPGAPSRWSTERSSAWEPLKTKLVVEVGYDHVTSERFRHGTNLIRWRPDKSPAQCTMEQLNQPKIMNL